MERLTYFENGHWRLDFNGCQYRAGFVDRLRRGIYSAIEQGDSGNVEGGTKWQQN